MVPLMGSETSHRRASDVLVGPHIRITYLGITDEPEGRVRERGVGETFPHAFGVTATPPRRGSAIGAEPLWKICS